MKNSEKNLINDYSFGSMTVNGKEYHEDLIVFPNRIKTNWHRKEGHSLFLSDLGEVFSFQPDILVVGRGESGILTIPESTRKEIQERGIQLIDGKTGSAYKTFNYYLKEGQKVIGAFHLTC